jgi:iron complex outermembrane receptor protein
MLGQSDFSLIPSGMVDNILVSFGGASMDLGCGAIGGIINLENDPGWKEQTLLDIISGAGSFGRYSGLVKVKTGSKYFQSVTKAFISSSGNNFLYLDTAAIPEPAWKKRENNKVLQKSFMQELYFRKSRNIFSARFWYHSASRDLPGSTQYGYAGETQSDESFRSLIDYDISKGENECFITAAWMLTRLNYASELYAIDSRNKANTLVLKSGMTAPIGEYSRLKLVVSDELNGIVSNNYSEKVLHNNASVTLSAERKKGRRFGAVILLRETLDDNSFLVPDFSAGFEFRVLRNEEHFLKLNLSRNSKIPSLNDRFWNPGGNPDLKNEYAYSYELGYRLFHNISPSLTLGSELNYYNNYIRDMIQWRPDGSWMWSAENIGSVNSSGFESSCSAKYLLNDFSARIDAGYSYTRARDKSDGTPGLNDKQLIYIPENQANGSFQLAYKNFNSGWTVCHTGPVFTDAQNIRYLKGYTINNLTGGFKFSIKKNSADLNLKIENIFDVSYETIAYYPQPGRSYFVTLSCHFE